MVWIKLICDLNSFKWRVFYKYLMCKLYVYVFIEMKIVISILWNVFFNVFCWKKEIKKKVMYIF